MGIVMSNKYINVYNPKNKNIINIEKIDISDSNCHVWNYNTIYISSSESLEDKVKKAWEYAKKEYKNTERGFFPAVIYDKTNSSQITAVSCHNDPSGFAS